MTEGVVVVVVVVAAAAAVVVSAEVAVVAVSVGYLIDGPIIHHNTNLIINNYSFFQAIMIYDLKEYKHMVNVLKNF